METKCDVNVHPDDMLEFHVGSSFRTVGTGTPQITVHDSDMVTKYPCLGEAMWEHEQVHYDNMLAPCRQFKTCVDEATGAPWYSLGLGTPVISKADYVACQNEYAKALKDCRTDEREAYEHSIAVATWMLTEVRCADDWGALQQAIDHWKGIKDCAPNCDECGATGSLLLQPDTTSPADDARGPSSPRPDTTPPSGDSALAASSLLPGGDAPSDV